MLLSPNSKEWLKLIMDSKESNVRSHLLKIKLNTLRRKVKHKLVTPEEAVMELYEDCTRHYDIYKTDLHNLFQEFNVKTE
jgi:hypothetical protein